MKRNGCFTFQTIINIAGHAAQFQVRYICVGSVTECEGKNDHKILPDVLESVGNSLAVSDLTTHLLMANGKCQAANKCELLYKSRYLRCFRDLRNGTIITEGEARGDYVPFRRSLNKRRYRGFGQ